MNADPQPCLKLCLNIFFKIDNITMDPDPNSKFCQNPGTGSKFIVFGSTTLIDI